MLVGVFWCWVENSIVWLLGVKVMGSFLVECDVRCCDGFLLVEMRKMLLLL